MIPAASLLVAGPGRIGGNAGQHTPYAHGGPLQPSHSQVCESAEHTVVHYLAEERKHELGGE